MNRFALQQPMAGSSGAFVPGRWMATDDNSHPDFGHLVLLVFEAVLEVVFVSLPGYIVARAGMFDTEAQKFVANLNVMVFTPCLIFTKLASKLTPDNLSDLIIIPFIFIAQTLVSFACAVLISKIFRFKKRPRNFVIAMGVFGNSNSLPISLVLSLSKTISGLHWDQVPNDNDSDVAARGILYLMVFQQLGQMMRWSWGFNVLLKPAGEFTIEEGGNRILDGPSYHDDPEEDDRPQALFQRRPTTPGNGEVGHPEASPSNSSPRMMSSRATNGFRIRRLPSEPIVPPLPTPSINTAARKLGHSTWPPPQVHEQDTYTDGNRSQGSRRPSLIKRTTQYSQRQVESFKASSAQRLSPLFYALPETLQNVLAFLWRHFARFCCGVWEFMNPPLWGMLAAIIVATVSDLQKVFFEEGTFVNNTFTSAVQQSAGVAVPLILVVLGANLARTTTADDPDSDDEEEYMTAAETRKLERKLLIASIVSRMLLPFLIMAPLLALIAKYVPVSILDDPIFIIVCFLLTGAPSALQLAQICQINNVYMGAVSRLLFQSYVVWLLPSTLMLVTCALEVVEWAQG